MLLKPQSLAITTIFIGIITLAIKLFAYWKTNSIALLSDAIESTLNIATALLTYFVVRISKKPADQNHPFGHHKAEYLSAIVDGILIGISSIFIIFYGAKELITHNVSAHFNKTGFICSIIATILNAIWALIIIKQGKKLSSFALAADGYHLLTDVWTSLGVICAIILAFFIHMPIIDPIVAIIVGFNILWMGWKIIKQSIDGLMDTAPPHEIMIQIQDIIKKSAIGALEFHDLRCRATGPILFIEFHLVVNRLMLVNDAHDICIQIQNALIHHFPDARIIIHLDPEHHKEKDGINIPAQL